MRVQAPTRRKEPKRRKDGICALPSCNNTVVIELVKDVPEHHRLDAFCSSICAKAYFEVDFSTRPSVPV